MKLNITLHNLQQITESGNVRTVQTLKINFYSKILKIYFKNLPSIRIDLSPGDTQMANKPLKRCLTLLVIMEV